VKEDRRDVVGRVDGAAVRQRRTAVAADAARRRPRSVVDLQEVRLAVGMFLELEARERQHERLTRQHTHASVRSTEVKAKFHYAIWFEAGRRPASILSATSFEPASNQLA